jgi:hypothetical protein
MSKIYTEVEVDVELDDFDTEDLIQELHSRNQLPVDTDQDAKDILATIWLQRRQGKPYDQLMDSLIYQVLGKIV